MKINYLTITGKYLLISLLIFTVSCNDEIEESNKLYPKLDPSNPDTNAGNWTPILLTSADEFSLDAPLPVTSSNYKAEINEIKSYQANISNEQKRIINYWSVGGVLRWNEIMQTLVAKHNRPPYQNPDGTYPFASSTNPFANPQFPFSNPPYAARAYAYVSAAQYDAMVATWHYKQLYNRAAPFVVDTTLTVLTPRSPLPSYPSEDGALAGVTVEILKRLFPTEIAYIQQKADEQKLYKIISGSNVRSDIEAGVTLGRKIAAKYILKAANDGAAAAIGNQVIWTELETNAIANGELPWKSLDTPPRPPMLPLFGVVKSFLMTPEDVISNRPPPPSSTNSQEFLDELNEVKHYSENVTREQIKIVSFWADGVGTSTPPGHWNQIANKAFVYEKYSEVRWARNMALLNISMMDAAISCWDAKYYYFNPRPSQVNPSIKTTTGVPNFPAYVSGHSTFSGAASTFLSHILPPRTDEFKKMAEEASVSRLYGAIHYKSDCENGLILGEKVASYAITRAINDGAE